MGYGRDATRYQENKRAVEEKYMGPLDQDLHDAGVHPVHALRALRH